MPPADPAALSAALATVRRLAEAERNRELLGELHVSPTWMAATSILAREIVRLHDAGELVRVKGLEWEVLTKRPDSRDETLIAKSVFANLYIWKSFEGWLWTYGLESGECESIDHAKRLADEWYRSRLVAALEPLFAKETQR